MIARILWNQEENRLRAGWRVLVHALAISLPILILGALGFYTRPGLSVEAWVVLTALPLTILVTWLAGRYIDKRNFADFGVHLRQKRWWAEYGYGWLVGMLSAAGFVYLLVLLDYGRVESAARIGLSPGELITGIVISMLVYAGVGVFEELMRVYQVRNITEGLAPTRLRLIGAVLVAVLISGAYSLVMHIPGREPSIPYLFYVLVTGSIYGLFYVWTGRAALAMAIHAAWDFTLTNIFAIGGATGVEPAIFSIPLHTLSGYEENVFHIMGLVGKVIGLVLVALWVYRREGGVHLKEDIAQPTRHVEKVSRPAFSP